MRIEEITRVFSRKDTLQKTKTLWGDNWIEEWREAAGLK
jgi:hypothetical protein